jgi:hypothetical protein
MCSDSRPRHLQTKTDSFAVAPKSKTRVAMPKLVVDVINRQQTVALLCLYGSGQVATNVRSTIERVTPAKHADRV